MFQREQLYWQSPEYDEPVGEVDEDVDLLEAFFSDDDEPEFLERDGMTFCYACGILACPGNEEFDWCDHRIGSGCHNMESSPFNEDNDWDDGGLNE